MEEATGKWRNLPEVKNVKQSRYRPKGPRGFQEVKVPRYQDTAQDSGKVVSLTHGRLYPQEMLPLLISVRGLVDPRALARQDYVNEEFQ
jgi:hypothetical protein